MWQQEGRTSLAVGVRHSLPWAARREDLHGLGAARDNGGWGHVTAQWGEGQGARDGRKKRTPTIAQGTDNLFSRSLGELYSNGA